MNRTPLKRKPAKRRPPKPGSCSVRGCRLRGDVLGLCVKHAEAKADRLFSIWVRERDRRCTAAKLFTSPCLGILQAAHIYSRRYHATRFEPDNCHGLCQVHHMLVDTHQAEKDRWARSIIGNERHIALSAIAEAGENRAAAAESALSWLAAA